MSRDRLFEPHNRDGHVCRATSSSRTVGGFAPARVDVIAAAIPTTVLGRSPTVLTKASKSIQFDSTSADDLAGALSRASSGITESIATLESQLQRVAKTGSTELAYQAAQS